MRLPLVFVVAAGCSHPAPPPAPAPPAPDCAAAVEGAMRIVAPHVKTAGDLERARGAVALRCVEDKWTVEATRCIAAVTEPDAAHKCLHDHATPAQRDALFKSLEGLLADAAPPTGESATIAKQLADEGVAALTSGNFAVASAKFREAIARVPEPKYFFDLCVSLFQEGKFGEAMTACHAARANQASPGLNEKIQKLEDKIKAEARSQGITLPPP